jgi:DNA processing protein
MNEQYIFDLVYQLTKPRVGQKTLKEMISRGVKFEKCPKNLRESLEKENIKIVPFWSDLYPKILKKTDDFPVLLFAKGDMSLLKKDFLTIVGSRKINDYSVKILEEVFERKKDFSKNICFVSGLAHGVDSEVHRLCLKKNLPTIGVIGGGIDRVYYRGNPVMYQYLCKYRLVLAEFPPNSNFFVGMFPLRNRILAGLSEKTFVIQAAKRSGAINTASHANNYGREVFVLPNNIFSLESQGCLNLISQGAGIITNIDDFVEKL